MQNAHKENMFMTSQVTLSCSDNQEDSDYSKDPLQSPVREVITKRAKPNTPEQSKAAFTMTSSSVIESPFASKKK